MASLEKISTLNDMKTFMGELRRLEVKFLYDFYAALQDFSSKKLFPQWLQQKSVNQNNIFVSEKGNDVLKKLGNSKKRSIVVYDLETPDLNGLQFLAALEKNPDLKARCKVILAVPTLASDARSKLMQMGVSAIISKPLEPEPLRAVFEKLGLD
ncbi:MAG: response regulator [Fibromonadales bacterium]|nr:response regulator [Fibromonadales bacterium]